MTFLCGDTWCKKGSPDFPEFKAWRPQNLYTCRRSVLCSLSVIAYARSAIVRVDNARQIVCSILLRVIDAWHKIYNFVDFSLPLNSDTDKVWCVLLPYGVEKSMKSLTVVNRLRIKTLTRTKICCGYAGNFYYQKNWFYIESPLF
jgi:hypothetical protein